jgi:hypothetical protein
MKFVSVKPKRSWRERLAADRAVARVRPIPPRMQKRAGRGTIVIPTLREVYALVRRIPKGEVTTIQHLGDWLAKKHRATIGCAVTTGIMAWMVAHVGSEEESAGTRRPVPYWRVLRTMVD